MILPRNSDGTFGTPQQLATNITGPITNIRSVNGLTVVDAGSASGRTMTFYDQNFNQAGNVHFSYASQDWWHSTGMSTVVAQPDGSYKVFFIVGSKADGARTTAHVTTSGLFQTTLNADSVYMTTLSSSGGTLHTVAAPVQVATGLRNAYGLVVTPGGDLLIGDNGQDVTHHSVDTINRIPLDYLGTTVFDFGFPDSYTNFFNCQRTTGNANATAPLVSFCSLPFGNAVDPPEGLAGMAFVNPGAMPFVGSQGGLMVGFHGYKDAAGAANLENGFLYYDLASGIYTPIVHTGALGIGHLDTVLINGSSMYIADMSTAGIVDAVGGNNSGTITGFSFAPEPATGLFAAAGLTLLLVTRKRA